MTDQLILVLHRHRQLGWRFGLYLATPLESGSMRIQGPPGTDFLRRQPFTADELELFRLIAESSDQALMKKYSKEKTVMNFLDKLKSETIEKLVRPAIEIYSARIVPLAEKTGIAVYLRDDLKRTVLYPKQKIHVLKEKTRCLFNFIKDDVGIRYFITLSNGSAEISLKGKQEIVIVNSPAMILIDNMLHRLENIDAKRLSPFYTKYYIAVPIAIGKKYMEDFVLKIFLQYPVKTTGIDIVRTRPERQFLLSLEEDFDDRTHLRFMFLYGDRQLAPTFQQQMIAWLDPGDDYRICCYERDPDWEQSCIRRLTDAGLTIKGDNRLYVAGQEAGDPREMIVWLNAHREALEGFVLQQNTYRRYFTENVCLQMDYEEKFDWFDVNILVAVGNYRIPFVRFRKNILSGNRDYVLPDDSVFVLPEEWFARYQDLFLYGNPEEGLVRLRKIHFEIKDRIFGEQKPLYFASLNAAEKNRLLQSVPSSLDGILRPYQKEGFCWLLHLYLNRFGGCLADDMGLGKTLQVIALLQYIYDRPPAAPDRKAPASLIVVPASLLHNWQREFQRFAPAVKLYLYAGNNRCKTKNIDRIFSHYHVIVTSYGILRNDADYLQLYAFHYLILDESQYVKNAASQTYKSVRKVPAAYRLALSGTPVENALSDLWAQFNFINEGLLGSYAFFRKTFAKPIAKGKDKAVEKELLLRIRPFILRRTKEEVTPELPPLLQEIVYCDMSDEQKKVYEIEKNSLRNNIIASIDRVLENKLIALQGLMRLRLLANHPSLLYPEYAGDSGKYEQIVMSFESLLAGGHKVLVFSSFVRHLKLIARAFDRQGWKYAMLTGQTSLQGREAAIAEFTDRRDVNCFFISLKAGGTGLNLVAADYVFIIDPWWNPAAEMQALSRAHRIGQSKHVIAYRFISTATIEEKILRLQEEKMQLSNIFAFANNPTDCLSAEEIGALFE
jgi:superfamily II DNA or RNA helicase